MQAVGGVQVAAKVLQEVAGETLANLPGTEAAATTQVSAVRRPPSAVFRRRRSTAQPNELLGAMKLS